MQKTTVPAMQEAQATTPPVSAALAGTSTPGALLPALSDDAVCSRLRDVAVKLWELKIGSATGVEVRLLCAPLA